MEIFYPTTTVANLGSLLKPDLRYSQGYLIPWVQREMGIFNPPTLPWLTQTARSSQTSGTVKDISYLGYSPGYIPWNGNFLFNNATTANQGSPLKPDYSSLGYTAWNGNFLYPHNATVANPGSPPKPDLRYSQEYLIPWVQLGIHCFKWEFLYSTTLPVANPGSLLKPDLKVKSGIYVLLEKKMRIFYPTIIPWITQAVRSSQTSGTVKNVRCLGYSLGYTAWNGNFFIQQRYHG